MSLCFLPNLNLNVDGLKLFPLLAIDIMTYTEISRFVFKLDRLTGLRKPFPDINYKYFKFQKKKYVE